MKHKTQNTKQDLFLLGGFLLIFFATSTQALAQSVLPRNLQIGDSGADVRILQQILNRDTETWIAISGPGSPGNETNYFGSLTQQAVIRYQEKHRSGVLTPLGLLSGTGFVGASTRSHMTRDNTITPPVQQNTNTFQNALNQLTNITRSFTSAPTNTPQGPQPFVQTLTLPLGGAQRNAEENGPHIDRVEPNQGKAGTHVTLHGRGFSKTDNTIYASFDALTGEVSPDGTTLTFTVKSFLPDEVVLPDSFNDSVQAIDYGFYVENNKGRSNAILFRLLF